MKNIVLGLVIILCACRNDSPPAPTPEQSNQLNEAENMLNEAANRDSNQ